MQEAAHRLDTETDHGTGFTIGCRSLLAAAWILFCSSTVADDRSPPNSPETSHTIGSTQGSQSAIRESQPRSIAEIHRDLRRLERETARTESDRARVDNILALCRLFVEVGEHPEIADSPTLQSLSVRLRTRLRGIERRTITELKRRKIPEPKQLNRSSTAKNQQTSATGGQSGNPADSRKQQQAATESNSDSSSGGRMSSEAELGNKAEQNVSSAKGHFAPGPDFGWSLVNLIQQTIRPDYWSVAGGPGKALYFGHSRALVIHGSWRVQEEVADLLAALRGY